MTTTEQNPGRLHGKIAVVSGAHQGIGRAVADRFLEEGATVIGGDLHFGGEHDSAVSFVPRYLDVADLESWEQLATHVRERAEGIDILVNNAGLVGSYDSITDVSVDDWHRIIGVNQHGVFYGMRTMIPLMKPRGGGSIINVSSIWGLVGASDVAAYQASKGAVTLMSKNAAMTYAAAGVRVNSVHPGLIETPMTEAQEQAVTDKLIGSTALGRAGAASEVANAILFLASDESSYVTGSQLVVDGGFTTQ